MDLKGRFIISVKPRVGSRITELYLRYSPSEMLIVIAALKPNYLEIFGNIPPTRRI